ncbi:MarR family transcriptional regulator [candidate division KSB1 bacterium]|nr:MarR family transcriptional regulator [candidate division KSB1 bacterium]
MKLLTEHYNEHITGILSCYDRVVITGTLPTVCYSQGMTSWLYAHNIRIFDYKKMADGLRLDLRDNAEKIAAANNIEIEYIRKKKIRKESIIQKRIQARGDHPGLVHIISAMETCSCYTPWYDKETQKTFVKPGTSQCLHYYFYFIDETLGLCYMRVPTWAPFRLQFYFNGHNWLASEMKREDIHYSLIDNALDAIDDFDAAQKLADDLDVDVLHRILDNYSRLFCPVMDVFEQDYHWSIMQAEYATDIVFKEQAVLKSIYDDLVAMAIHTVKPDNIATFLGRKLHGNYQQEMGNRYNVRMEGSRIKHSMGKCSIKMYDKFQKILRIETTTNDVSFFQHYRTVEHRDGSTTKKYASMKKNIYSFKPLKKNLKSSNRRYLEFISAFKLNTDGREKLNKLSQPKADNGRNFKGFNFFNKDDLNLLLIIVRGEFLINGFRNKNLRYFYKGKSSSQISRILKRLRLHQLIRKVAGCHKYYLTALGKQIICGALSIKEQLLIPAFNSA